MEDWQERDAEADRIQQMYEDVEDEIIALLVAAYASGLLERVKEAAFTSKRLLAESLYQAQVWEAEAIPALYGEAVEFSQTSVSAVASASDARFVDMTATVSRRIDDLVSGFEVAVLRREALAGYTAERAGLSVRALADALERDLRARGITSFTDAAGRKWRLSTYADMAARTTTMDAQLAGIKDRTVAAGRDLVQIVGPLDYPDGCPAAVLGGPYSLTGVTPNVMTLSQAIEFYGVFHPRCRHSIIGA